MAHTATGRTAAARPAPRVRTRCHPAGAAPAGGGHWHRARGPSWSRTPGAGPEPCAPGPRREAAAGLVREARRGPRAPGAGPEPCASGSRREAAAGLVRAAGCGRVPRSWPRTPVPPGQWQPQREAAAGVVCAAGRGRVPRGPAPRPRAGPALREGSGRPGETGRVANDGACPARAACAVHGPRLARAPAVAGSGRCWKTDEPSGTGPGRTTDVPRARLSGAAGAVMGGGRPRRRGACFAAAPHGGRRRGVTRVGAGTRGDGETARRAAFPAPHSTAGGFGAHNGTGPYARPGSDP